MSSTTEKTNDILTDIVINELNLNPKSKATKRLMRILAKLQSAALLDKVGRQACSKDEYDELRGTISIEDMKSALSTIAKYEPKLHSAKNFETNLTVACILELALQRQEEGSTTR